MSILGKIFSAVAVAGATMAVGAIAKKVSDKATQTDDNSEVEFIGEADSTVSLSENLSTGYKWIYKMSKSGIVKETKNESENSVGLNGSGGVRKFEFAPVNDGVTELEFDYVKASEPPIKTITYTFEVKNKKIVRGNAAGDLESIYKY